MDLDDIKRRDMARIYLDMWGGVGSIRAWEIHAWNHGDALGSLTGAAQLMYLVEGGTPKGGVSFGSSPK